MNEENISKETISVIKTVDENNIYWIKLKQSKDNILTRQCMKILTSNYMS